MISSCCQLRIDTHDQKSPRDFSRGLSINNPGGFLLSHAPARAVPSAPRGLTSVFGMGTGVTLSTKPPENLSTLSAELGKSNSESLRLPFAALSALQICLLLESKFYGQAKGLISSGQ